MSSRSFAWRKFAARLTTIQTILILYVVLGFAYSVITPAFETPDELAHFAYIRQLVSGHGFPTPPIVIADDSPAQESSQPPVYYLSAALAVRLFAPDTSDFFSWVRRNPAFPYIFGATHNDNKNLLIHDRVETFPYEGAVRALHIARWMTLLFGALTVWCTYRLGREIFFHQPTLGLLAAALVAFTPQFLFISGAASNDPAASALSALSLWIAVRIMRCGFTLRRALGLGLALSLAALSKASAIGLIPLCLLAVLAIDQASSKMTARFKWVLLVAAMIVLLVGPWYVHTRLSFGDVLGTSTHMMMPWARPIPLSFGEAVTKLPDATMSYWLAFGWGNILAPDWLYACFDLLMLAGLAGAALWWLTNRRDPALRIERASVLLLGAWTLTIVVALVRWIQLLNAALGRLVFPAIAAMSLLLVVGWLHWVRRVWLVAVIPLALLGLSIAGLPFIMSTAYARPPILTPEDAARQPGKAVDVRFNDVARLVRLGVRHDRWPHPGEGMLVNLCWEPLRQDDRRLMVLVQVVGENNHVWFSRRTVPGLGSYPTSIWQPGGLFCDPVHVQIDEKTPPGIYQLEIAMIDYFAQERVPAYAPDGAPLTTNFVDRIKIAPWAYATPTIKQPVNHELGDQVALIGYDLDRTAANPGATIRLRLYWQALQRPAADYTVFAQVRTADNQMVAQKDSPPQSGAYPTSYWDAGEVVIDDREIEIPANASQGKYPVKVGMYLPSDGSRLPIDGDPTVTEVTLPLEIEIQ